MLRNLLIFSLHVLIVPALTPGLARAQTSDISGCKTDLIQSLSSYTVNADQRRLQGSSANPVQVDCDDMQVFAATIDLFSEKGRIVAVGDVVFVSGASRISADRLEFDTRTKNGTFFNASGTSVVKSERGPLQMTGTQEPNAFFWGEELHKVGPRKFKIVRGGFTACVQPTPRWDVASGNITVNLDDYVLLRNSIFRVKSVPLMYLPIFYYPIDEDDRSTGFTMPIYGTSTQKGQQLSNQFFWAIGRSHDATLVHDWFSKAGQGFGGEYRYVLAPGSQGDARVYMLNESEVTAEEASGSQPARPGARSYTVTGNLSQQLPFGMRAQGSANYFSSLTTQQRYQQDVYQATQRQRSFGGNVVGNWAGNSLSARFDQTDYFDNEDTLTRTGSLPRITVSRGERQIGKAPIYFGATGEYVTLVRSVEEDGVVDEARDRGLTRLDVFPTVRVPFTKWSFFTVNSSIGWRGTYWTESLDAASRQQIEDAISRQYFDLQARATGPVFTRIFDTPNNGYATRWKHVIEPSLTIQRTTAIENFDQIVQLESPDYVVGSVTRYAYGLTNRLYAKKDVSREFASISLSQSYYTDQNAAQYDQNYQSDYTGTAAPTNFTPVTLLARVSPTDRIGGQFRTEWDTSVEALRTLAASGTFGNGSWFESSAGWSLRRYIPELPDYSEAASTHALNGSTTLRTRTNRLGGTYNFDYDFKNGYLLQQRIIGYYNAQCCGVAVEWQTWNLLGVAGITVPQDRRFNISFTLAGIGTFSNFFGALSGQEQRR
jgi:LPS-assembly protein